METESQIGIQERVHVQAMETLGPRPPFFIECDAHGIELRTMVGVVSDGPRYRSTFFHRFFKTPAIIPRPETSNPTVAGSGTSFTSFIPNAAVPILSSIVFTTPNWSENTWVGDL